MPIPLIAIAITTMTYITSNSWLVRAIFGENFRMIKLMAINTIRKNIAPIKSAVEVISVTPVIISELDTQKQAIGISNSPIITERNVILFWLLWFIRFVYFIMPSSSLVSSVGMRSSTALACVFIAFIFNAG
jgi:hypothetical protein